MKASKKTCEVCGVAQAVGVFSSRIAPVSCAYCKSCMEKGGEPFGILVIHVVHLMLMQPGYVLSPQLESVKQATLDITGMTQEKFLEDVEFRMTQMEIQN